MKIQLRKDLISGIFFFLLSLTLWWIIPYEIKIKSGSIVNSQTFPKLIALVIFLCSMFLIISDIRKILRKDESTRITIVLNQELKAVILCIFLLGYAFLMETIGFLFSSLIFSTAMLLFFKCKKKKYYLILFLLCLAVNYIFKNLLLVQLP